MPNGIEAAAKPRTDLNPSPPAKKPEVKKEIVEEKAAVVAKFSEAKPVEDKPEEESAVEAKPEKEKVEKVSGNQLDIAI